MSFDQAKRRRVYALRFSDQFPGLVIQCRKPGYLPFRKVAQAVLALGDDLSGRGMPGDALLEAWAPLLEAFQASIVRWNLLDDGRSVPVSRLLDQDWEFLVATGRAWYRDVVIRFEGADRPQGVDEPVDNSPEDYPVPAQHQDTQLPPTIGEPGTDEEWLTQFAMHEPPPEPDENGEGTEAEPVDVADTQEPGATGPLPHRE